MRIILDTLDRLSIAGELMRFLWKQKMWWMIPLVAVLLFVSFVLFVGTATGVGPFIYTLF